MLIKCSQCNNNEYKIVAFEVIKQSEKLDVMLPICEKCALKYKRRYE